MRTSALLLSISLLGITPLQADSWDVTQHVIAATNTALFQENSSGSVQALNAIQLGDTGTLSHAEQSVDTGGYDLTLSQTGTGGGNRQAANLIIVGHITDASQSVTVGGARLTRAGEGNDNVQALNMAIATSTGVQIDALAQDVTASSVAFELNGGSGNIQAGNYLQASSVSSAPGFLTQNFSVSGTVTYNESGLYNLQAGNVVIKEDGALFSGAVTQDFSATNVVPGYHGINETTGSVKAANYFGPTLQ